MKNAILALSIFGISVSFADSIEMESTNSETFVGCSVEHGGGRTYPNSPCAKTFKARSKALTQCHRAGFQNCETVGRSCEAITNGHNVCVKVKGIN